ncbi:MAG: alpha-L-fucosidase precursor [Lentisphaerae bacterium]|jgi:alpha-L-fucosidase|nr:alpha-L-fucosidase precursor [Lentisphaerota bacterium]MBT5608471.1 alpha-L-fucosidase precursor [Lentisphaerota bacterium]MBT7062146.1 alpha-L-fucosidase precursor [Lentisphaerota bacterium]MBT7844022.1 alpha-L-fucosidase precursor [Lentisphaerota bacterium]
MRTTVPSFLSGYETLYAESPRAATLAWFREAQFGLFIHYGLYSLLEKGEWVQYHDRIPIAEYAKLKDRFTAERFDARGIADLALEAGMRYVNLVTKHCDSFCLWDTQHTDFNSVNSPCGRDLVREMADACAERGLGFFAFYEHGFDWRHPHGPAPWDWAARTVRPHYDPPDPYYASREEYDFANYLDYVTGHIAELCSSYGTLAGVWLDGAGIPASGDKSLFRLPELYSLVRRLQPQALISYKYGIEPELEDFFAPEEPQVQQVQSRWGKPVEVCGRMQRGPTQWAYHAEAEHLNADEVLAKLDSVRGKGANLLLNIGPLGDGSVHPDDVTALRAAGALLRR